MQKNIYHTIVHSGLSGESITETRVRMYQKQKIKTSSTLVSDEESIVKDLMRSDLECFIWNQCLKKNIIIPKLEERGWYMKDAKVLPVWYVGEQLPSSLSKRKPKNSFNSSKYANKSDVADDSDAADDDDDYIPMKKRPKVCFIS